MLLLLCSFRSSSVFYFFTGEFIKIHVSFLLEKPEPGDEDHLLSCMSHPIIVRKQLQRCVLSALKIGLCEHMLKRVNKSARARAGSENWTNRKLFNKGNMGREERERKKTASEWSNEFYCEKHRVRKTEKANTIILEPFDVSFRLVSAFATKNNLHLLLLVVSVAVWLGRANGRTTTTTTTTATKTKATSEKMPLIVSINSVLGRLISMCVYYLLVRIFLGISIRLFARAYCFRAEWLCSGGDTAKKKTMQQMKLQCFFASRMCALLFSFGHLQKSQLFEPRISIYSIRKTVKLIRSIEQFHYIFQWRMALFFAVEANKIEQWAFMKTPTDTHKHTHDIERE